MELVKAIILGLAIRGGLVMGLATLFLFLIVLAWLLIRALKVQSPKVPRSKIKQD